MDRRKKKTSSAEKPQYTCKDCKNSYGWCSKALDGHLILCRCKYYTNGRWCKFLHDRQCEHFIKREVAENG